MIAITGALGFVGSRICAVAAGKNLRCRALVRSTPASFPPTVERPIVVGDFGLGSFDPAVLAGCTAIIHTAARAHRMGETGHRALADYRRVNVDGTRVLLRAMQAADVGRMVYVSSIKAVGERSSEDRLHPQSDRHPADPYGQSKAEAEDAIAEACAKGALKAVILRPVLVHGPGAKGNLQQIMEAIWHGRPLPLGAVRNRRSMVGVENLADALLAAATASLPEGDRKISDVGSGSGDAVLDGHIAGTGLAIPEHTNGLRSRDAQSGIGRPRRPMTVLTYHIADDGVISTRRLVEVLAEGMGVQPRLISVPRWLAVGGATLLGKGAMARRLFDDLEVDDSDFRRDFAWKPRLDLEDGLRLMAADFAIRMQRERTEQGQ